MSKIEWTDKTWNVITGCTQISPACDNCYAKAMTKHLQGKARKELEKKTNLKCQECDFHFNDHDIIEYFIKEEMFYNNNYKVSCVGAYGGLEPHKPFDLPKYYLGWNKVVFHKESLNDILDKKKYPSGSKVIVNSMSDTFHEEISEDDLVELFKTMSKRQDLIFQILTKRPNRMFHFLSWVLPRTGGLTDEYLDKKMKSHIWFGVTAENQRYADLRINNLLHIKDYIDKDIKCFVSIEPMLSEIDLTPYLDKLDWVIIGGEKIPNNPSKARLMKWEWVDSIYNQCKKDRVPLFFKQWGNNPTKSCHTRAESCKEFPRD